MTQSLAHPCLRVPFSQRYLLLDTLWRMSARPHLLLRLLDAWYTLSFSHQHFPGTACGFRAELGQPRKGSGPPLPLCSALKHHGVQQGRLGLIPRLELLLQPGLITHPQSAHPALPWLATATPRPVGLASRPSAAADNSKANGVGSNPSPALKIATGELILYFVNGLALRTRLGHTQ